MQSMVQAYLGIKPKEDVRMPTPEECTAYLKQMAAKAKF